MNDQLEKGIRIIPAKNLENRSSIGQRVDEADVDLFLSVAEDVLKNSAMIENLRSSLRHRVSVEDIRDQMIILPHGDASLKVKQKKFRTRSRTYNHVIFVQYNKESNQFEQGKDDNEQNKVHKNHDSNEGKSKQKSRILINGKSVIIGQKPAFCKHCFKFFGSFNPTIVRLHLQTKCVEFNHRFGYGSEEWNLLDREGEVGDRTIKKPPKPPVIEDSSQSALHEDENRKLDVDSVTDDSKDDPQNASNSSKKDSTNSINSRSVQSKIIRSNSAPSIPSNSRRSPSVSISKSLSKSPLSSLSLIHI